MPETEIEFVTKEWLQTELRSAAKDLIILDCRSSNEFTEGHIRSAVNFSIPSIMLRRLAAGKIDLLSTIKSRDLKERIQSNYKISLFVLYNDNNFVCSPTGDDGGNNIISGICGGGGLINKTDNGANDSGNGCNISDLTTIEQQQQQHHHHHYHHQQQQQQKTTNLATITNLINSSELTNTTTINVLHRRLKQDGCRVVYLQDGFSSFRDAFPEWCEEDSQSQEVESSRGTVQADQLMGLRSLRISTPHSDSACSSSAESSDCESTTHHNFNEAPVEIVPGLFLGNASHSGDSRALQKYNIKYVLNVTPDLPNVFEGSGGIQYLQIPITDHYSQDLAVHFPKAIQFIDEARSKGAAVLVHCLAGVSRSVTVTLAYLMHTKSLCLNDAFTLVRDRKPDVSPNFHFMEQLHSFERQIRISPNRTLSSTCSTMLSSSSAASTDTTTRKEYEVRCQRSIATKFPCTCVESSTSTSSECKCMQAEFLVNVRPTGVSPDSGIEFDRWTPSDGGLK